MIHKYNIIASIDDNNMRVDKFLSKEISELSRSQIQKFIEEGMLNISGVIIKDVSHSVKPEVNYELTIPPPKPSNITPFKHRLDIVYEDDSLLVVNKEAGITTHPGAGHHDDTLVNILVDYLGNNLSSIGGVERPGIVHRLDKDTSGLLVIAKTDIAHHSLSNQIAERSLKRVYKAFIWNVPSNPIGVINQNIARSNKDRTKMTVVKSAGKHAITHYKVIEVFGDNIACEVECRLETGRTHQIRVHFSHLGHSLIGDQTYGHNNRKSNKADLSFAKEFTRQALHSTAIGFRHPVSGELMEFAVEMPEDMIRLKESLGNI